MLLISSNERKEVKEAFGEDAIGVQLPYDFHLYTLRGPVVAERKKCPSDLLASVTDGRLAGECRAMREASEYRILILEGEIQYTSDGHVRDGRNALRWTQQGVRDLLRSVRYTEGVDIEFTNDIPDTVQLLKGVQLWFDQPKHGSFRDRPGLKPQFFEETKQERFWYWLQGLPSIKQGRAQKIAEVFRTPESVLSASMEDWKSVDGIGQKLAHEIYEFLHRR